MEGFICGAGCMAFTRYLWKSFESRQLRPLSEINTGEQRRRNCPPDVELTARLELPGDYLYDECKKSTPPENPRGFITLKSGYNLFWQMLLPARGGPPKAGLVMLLGLMDHSDSLTRLRLQTLCTNGNLAVLVFDMPGHGRSDGLFLYMPSWNGFVDQAEEALIDHLLPKLRALKPGMKIFGMGDSMGGGVLTTLLLRNAKLFDGAILVYPMLWFADEKYPPAAFFKVLNLLRAWAPEKVIFPGPDLADLAFEDKDWLALLKSFAKSGPGVQPPSPCGFRMATMWGLLECHTTIKPKMTEFDTPALIMHSPDDKVTDYGITKILYESMKNEDKQLDSPPGLGHCDMFHGGPKFAAETAERVKRVLQWIEERS